LKTTNSCAIFLKEVNKWLSYRGHFISKARYIVDTTLIEAYPAHKNKAKEIPRCSKHQKGKPWYLGFTSPYGVDR